MELSLTQLITGGLLAGILALIGLVISQKSQLVRIETILTGASGDMGVVGDVRALREWRREVEEQGLSRRVGALEDDRRHGPKDRRAGA